MKSPPQLIALSANYAKSIAVAGFDFPWPFQVGRKRANKLFLEKLKMANNKDPPM